MPETAARAAREKAHFDRLARDTGGHWWGNRTAAGRLRQDRRAELARQRLGLGPGRRVLELGCGAGDFSRRLATTGAGVVALDLSPAQALLASVGCPGGNPRFAAGDAVALPFADGSFDAVAGNAVLHHLDLGPALAEIARVLKPAGGLFFAEPNLLNPQVWLEKRIRWIGRRLDNSPDETAFLRHGLAARLAAAGFDAVAVEPFDFLHPATPRPMIAWVRRLERGLERLPAVREIAGSLAISARRPAAARREATR